MFKEIAGLQVLETQLGGSKPIRQLFKKRNRKARRAALRGLREQYIKYTEDGGDLSWWDWIWENRDEILAFILKLIALFAAL